MRGTQYKIVIIDTMRYGATHWATLKYFEYREMCANKDWNTIKCVWKKIIAQAIKKNCTWTLPRCQIYVIYSQMKYKSLANTS